MDVTIARACVDDADELMEAQNAAFKSDFDKYGECPSYLEERQAMVDKIRTTIFYKIVLSGGKIVGGLEIRPRNDFHYHLYAISVHPEHQNMGIGTRALELMLARHPEAVIWSLATPRDNARTRHLYEKMGFVVSGEAKSPGGVPLTIYELLSGKFR